MVNRLLTMGLHPLNFPMKRRFPSIQLSERQWIERLPREERQRVGWAQGTVIIHAGKNAAERRVKSIWTLPVDPGRHPPIGSAKALGGLR